MSIVGTERTLTVCFRDKADSDDLRAELSRMIYFIHRKGTNLGLAHFGVPMKQGKVGLADVVMAAKWKKRLIEVT